ncbi:MAG: Gfo/Idh/MocA family oxidoreductase [Lachnospiraceae bacterium]|nr:Gfo/Idh/MocA family oxidoreductase [Lachnospiraceae bacterium]
MKFAIMATGWIAEKMAITVAELSQVERYAVASRSLEKAREFADKYGFEKYYGSYEELVQDPEVELVYVATPHSHHYECAKLCLENDKPALVEKAFCVNAKQARELIRLSEERKVFLTEAFWTRFMPARTMVEDLLKRDVIGEVTSVVAGFGLSLEHRERLVKPELAGGALLDLGVYPLNFALMFVNSEVKEVISSAVLSPEGVDWSNGITLTFENGCQALLHSNMRSLVRNEGVIYGKKGYIEVCNTNDPEAITVYNMHGEVVESLKIPEQITGYEYEVLACMEALQQGKLECEQMPHRETLRMMELLDTMRAQWGMKFPCENV